MLVAEWQYVHNLKHFIYISVAHNSDSDYNYESLSIIHGHHKLQAGA